MQFFRRYLERIKMRFATRSMIIKMVGDIANLAISQQKTLEMAAQTLKMHNRLHEQLVSALSHANQRITQLEHTLYGAYTPQNNDKRH